MFQSLHYFFEGFMLYSQFLNKFFCMRLMEYTFLEYFQVEPNSMLFPAVFFEPTNKEVLQVEFGRTKVLPNFSFKLNEHFLI